MLYLDLYLISVIMVIVVDISGFVENLEGWIARRIGAKAVHIHLIECSLCTTWWCCLLYLILNNQISILNIAISLFIAFMTPVTQDILWLIRDVLTRIITKLQ